MGVGQGPPVLDADLPLRLGLSTETRLPVSRVPARVSRCKDGTWLQPQVCAARESCHQLSDIMSDAPVQHSCAAGARD